MNHNANFYYYMKFYFKRQNNEQNEKEIKNLPSTSEAKIVRC